MTEIQSILACVDLGTAKLEERAKFHRPLVAEQRKLGSKPRTDVFKKIHTRTAKRRQVTEETIAAIRAGAERGLSLEQIAKETGITLSVVIYWSRKNGIKTRRMQQIAGGAS